MLELKKILCVILSAAMIITIAPLDVLAGEIQGEIDLNLEEILTEEEPIEEEFIEGELVEEEPIEELEIFEETEIIDELPEEENIYSIEGQIEGEDYEAGVVCAYVDSLEEAERIADEYGISIKEYNCPITSFDLSEDLSVAELVTLSDNLFFPKYYGRTGSLNEALVPNDGDSEMGLSSYVVDQNYYDPYLEEDDSQYQWHHEVIGSPYAWKSNITGSGVKIAILSSGINEHSDFASFDSTVVSHKNIITGTTGKSNCTDNEGGGTALAGIIGANYDNYMFGAGVAPGAKIYNVKISNSGNLDLDDALNGIYYAINQGVDIILIDACFDAAVSAWQTAISTAYDNGIAVFAPAAYSGDQYEVWPAACDHVIAVGASNKNNQRMGSSAYNSHIDIVAPGEAISTCSKDMSSYVSFDGTALPAGIAAGEAALILSDKAKIKTFYKNGVLISKSPALVDALEKHMKASTVSAGSGTGKGIVYLPKALSLGTITDGPKAPTIYAPGTYPYGFYVDTVDGVDVLKYIFDLQTDNYDSDFPTFYYTLDGKTPSYKNGKKDPYSLWCGSTVDTVIDASKNSFTIKAILVDHMGMASPVATYTVPMNFVKQIKISAPSTKAKPEAVKGKKLKFTASTLPSNSYAKPVSWHISYSGSEQAAKNNNVTINASGEVVTKATSISGDYKIWAVSKKDSSVKSNEMTITVRDSGEIAKILTLNKKVVEYRGDSDSEFDLITDKIDPYRVDSSPVQSTDLYFTSSNAKVVKVYHDTYGWHGVKIGPGKANITVCDAYGMGINATYSVEVVQLATNVRINGDTYNKVSKGKSISLTSTIEPYNSKVKTVSWSVYNKYHNPVTSEGIKVSKGKVTASKTTPAGKYYIKAEVINPDGSSVSSEQEITVIDELVTKITPSVKNITIFSKNNIFAEHNYPYLTNGEFLVDIVGGERSTEGRPLLNAFSITPSNDNLLYCTTDTVDGKIKVALSASGNGYGKATVTIAARDGSGKKAIVNVNVINPVSSVKIAPAKAGMHKAVSQGKTLQLKATLGEGYGKISNKNVIWSVPYTSDQNYVKVSSGGLVTAKIYNFATASRNVTIRAEAADGSGAFEDTVVTVYKPFGKIEICSEWGSTGKSFPSKGEVRNNKYNPEGTYNCQNFYVKIKDTGAPLNVYNDFVYSSSNPTLATVRASKGWDPGTHKYNGYYIYKFDAMCVLTPAENKAGTAKLTVKTKDGSQSVTYTLKVNK